MSNYLLLYLLNSSSAAMYEQLDNEEKCEHYSDEAAECWYKLSDDEIKLLENHPIFNSAQDVLDRNFSLIELI